MALMSQLWGTGDFKGGVIAVSQAHSEHQMLQFPIAATTYQEQED